MKKTPSRFRSRRCSSSSRSLVAVVAPVLLLTSGCASYVRIDARDAMPASSRTDEDPRFCVVDCTLETHKTFAVFPGEKGGMSTQKVDGIQSALQAANPDWFSSDTDTVPICVKIRVDLTTGQYWSNPLTCLPAMLTFWSTPSTISISFDLATCIQLGPGKWADAVVVVARKEERSVNYVSAVLFPSWTAPEKGWRKGGLSLADDNGDNSAADGPVIVSAAGQFNLMEDLTHADGPGGADPHFAIILANEIVKTWQSLSAGEKRLVRNNPMAAKLKLQLYPEMKSEASNTGFAVPEALIGPSRSSQGVPTLVSYGYDKATRRGHVEVAKNGAEHLATLKWAREQAIPKIAGNGAIQILSEKTLENGNTRIKFEVVQ